jgi:hypothetical protein
VVALGVRPVALEHVHVGVDSRGQAHLTGKRQKRRHTTVRGGGDTVGELVASSANELSLSTTARCLPAFGLAMSSCDSGLASAQRLG